MAQPVVEAGEAGVALVKLMAGSTVASLAIDGAERRAAALRSVLDDYVNADVRVVWVGNPLRSPLTIERFLLQVVGPEVDLRIERGAPELATLLAGCVQEPERLLVVVQQPETIPPDVMELLGAVVARLSEARARLQLLFVGTSGLRLPRAPRPVVAPEPAPSPPDPPVSPPMSPPTGRFFPVLFLLGVIGVSLVVGMRGPQGPVPAVAGQMSAADIAAFRYQFDRLMGEQGRPHAAPASHEALFAELLNRLRR